MMRHSEHSDLRAFPHHRGFSLSPLVSRLFDRRLSALLLLLVLLAEGAVGAFIMRDLIGSYAAVQKMYDNSVQGLRAIGELQYQTQETRRSTLYALTTNDGNLQVEYADQSRAADRMVTGGIQQYVASARTPREKKIGLLLVRDWGAYLQVRDSVLGLILESSTKEAVELDLTAGVPLFERVRQDLDGVKTIYDEEANEQLASVEGTSRRTMIKLAVAFGFAILFGSIAFWAIEATKARAALQLAKMQMEFVASVSHELRTPITAILTAGENVRDGFVNQRSDLVEQGSIITNQATQLMHLVDQVLQFSKTSQPAHLLQELEVSEVVAQALHSASPIIEQAGFTVEKMIEPDLPPVVGDLSVLSGCLHNLIVNAVKYGGRSRKVAVFAALEPDPREIRIDVKDWGLGISKEDLTHIFDPFYRSPRVLAARIEGTGLGLSIARRSAEAFGGHLSVETEVGVGSVFTLHIPAESSHKLETSAGMRL